MPFFCITRRQQGLTTYLYRGYNPIYYVPWTSQYSFRKFVGLYHATTSGDTGLSQLNRFAEAFASCQRQRWLQRHFQRQDRWGNTGDGHGASAAWGRGGCSGLDGSVEGPVFFFVGGQGAFCVCLYIEIYIFILLNILLISPK